MSKSEFPESADTKGNHKVTARVQPNLKKFRQANPRVDYYPTPEAMAAIEWLRERHPKASTRELIDALVRKGKDALSGNAKPQAG